MSQLQLAISTPQGLAISVGSIADIENQLKTLLTAVGAGHGPLQCFVTKLGDEPAAQQQGEEIHRHAQEGMADRQTSQSTATTHLPCAVCQPAPASRFGGCWLALAGSLEPASQPAPASQQSQL